jgi:hypothetical protein
MNAIPHGSLAPETDAHNELQCYTLAHGDPAFLHQHVVDAWIAQHANERTKPIGLTFALVGLYLHVERGFSGRQVQRVHMALGRCKRQWPKFALPLERGSVTASEVMTHPAGPERDRAIGRWCVSVWNAFRESHRPVAELLEHDGIVSSPGAPPGRRVSPVPGGVPGDRQSGPPQTKRFNGPGGRPKRPRSTSRSN